MNVSFCFSWTGFEDLQKNSFQKHCMSKKKKIWRNKKRRHDEKQKMLFQYSLLKEHNLETTVG